MPFEKALSWEDAQTRSLGYTHERVTRVYKDKTSSQPANLSERIHERKTIFNTFVERSGLLQFKKPISVLDIGGERIFSRLGNRIRSYRFRLLGPRV